MSEIDEYDDMLMQMLNKDVTGETVKQTTEKPTEKTEERKSATNEPDVKTEEVSFKRTKKKKRHNSKKVELHDIAEQAELGVGMLDHVKDVLDKFGKHQMNDINRLLDGFEKYSLQDMTKQSHSGARHFTQCCHLIFQLITETLRAQCRLGEFLTNKIVPTLHKYVQVLCFFESTLNYSSNFFFSYYILQI
ncbi:hypothetical protein RFI_04153 [Reticulomyxa filosa]|uniref:Uncharacterized protein n=1 Tax=Reticulomyxa filosa TaxID=46433 RepID=X6P5R8_RETFI|nr:hypothetical protein RFI_04153 [Reticulomyxa filosa]|eukprot:ETO32952.1 hypothetical protein RFI_04153 [Reticulomyxa filosa]